MCMHMKAYLAKRFVLGGELFVSRIFLHHVLNDCQYIRFWFSMSILALVIRELGFSVLARGQSRSLWFEWAPIDILHIRIPINEFLDSGTSFDSHPNVYSVSFAFSARFYHAHCVKILFEGLGKLSAERNSLIALRKRICEMWIYAFCFAVCIFYSESSSRKEPKI